MPIPLFVPFFRLFLVIPIDFRDLFFYVPSMTEKADILPDVNPDLNPDLEPTPESDYVPVDETSGKISALEEALAITKDQLLRTVADMDNLRKRSVREREDAGKYAVSSFARDLLDVADTFQRALQAIPEDLRQDGRINSLIQGIEATERSLLSCFEKNGIRKIEPMDVPFDPNFHEVMFEAPVPNKASGIIIQLIEPGYVIHDRLLRPARVGVAKSDDSGAGHKIDTQA